MPEVTTQAASPRPTGSVILTDKLIARRVTERVKFYDRKTPGLYVSVTTAGVATFYLKFTDPVTGKQRSGWLGVHGKAFTVADARARVYAIKGLGTAALAETFRDRKAQQAKAGKTVAEVIAERVEWMKTPVRKPDGEMRPRIETWSNVASHLRRFLSPRLGRKLASEVSRSDIQTMSDDIVAGRLGVPSISNARHMRRAASGLFRWALRREYVTSNPCSDLEPLDAEHPRTRVLSEAEIKALWWGLDRADLPWDRRTRLALRFELTTMLRSAELLGAQRSELVDLDGDRARIDVPLRRVKKRRVLKQPLSDLAVEIIREALTSDAQQHVFMSPLSDQPMNRQAMATALRGTKRKDGSVKTPGICALLGLKPFSPHDLRRSAASWARLIGQPMSKIALCLVHRVTAEDCLNLPPDTGRHYVHAEDRELTEKREVLQAWADELRRIIGEPEAKAVDWTELRLAA